MRACWCGATESVEIARFDETVVPRDRLLNDAVLLGCQGCGVLALDPQPDDAALAAAYASEYYGTTRKKFSGPIAGAVGLFQGARGRRIARRVPKGGRVLDVGCGNGGFLMDLQRRGYLAEGTERSAASAERVPADSGVRVHVGDLLELDLEQKAYDAVTMWHVLEHVRRPYETLQKVKSLLKPNGWFFVAVPNAASTQAQRYGAHWFHHDPPRHLFGFGPRSLSALLAQVGFRVVSSTTFSLEQNPFGELQSALNAAGSRPRDRFYDRLRGVKHEGQARLPELARVAALLVPAIARSTLESLLRKGATLEVEARLL